MPVKKGRKRNILDSSTCDEFFAKMYTYLDNCPNKTPTVAGLAKYMSVGRSSLYEWAELWEEIADFIELISTHQEVSLIDNGLDGTFNPAITKMLLSRLGYADKTETDVTSGGKQLNAWTVTPVTTEKE